MELSRCVNSLTLITFFGNHCFTGPGYPAMGGGYWILVDSTHSNRNLPLLFSQLMC